MSNIKKQLANRSALWLIFVVMGFIPLCIGVFLLTKDGIIPLKETTVGTITAAEYIAPIDNNYNRYAVTAFYTVDDIAYTCKTDSHRASPAQAKVDSEIYVYYNILFPQISTLDSSKCDPDKETMIMGFLAFLMGVAFIVIPLIAFFGSKDKEPVVMHIKSLTKISDIDKGE